MKTVGFIINFKTLIKTILLFHQLFIPLINCMNAHVERLHMILLVGSCKHFSGLVCLYC